MTNLLLSHFLSVLGWSLQLAQPNLLTDLLNIMHFVIDIF